MKAIEFEGHNAKIAEDQEEYNTLPAHVNTKKGVVTCCFELDEEEMKQVTETGRIWLQMMTFNGPVQPIRLSTFNPFPYSNATKS